MVVRVNVCAIGYVGAEMINRCVLCSCVWEGRACTVATVVVVVNDRGLQRLVDFGIQFISFFGYTIEHDDCLGITEPRGIRKRSVCSSDEPAQNKKNNI